MVIYYRDELFKALKNTHNGEISNETIFTYQQQGNILTSTYTGGAIKVGSLLGIVQPNGKIDMKYHHINTSNKLMSGTCQSTPELLQNGKIRLYENWKWTSGDQSSGTSIIEEI